MLRLKTLFKMILLVYALLTVPVFASGPPPICEEVGFENRIVDISAGRSHVCSLFQNGRIKCWGLNEDGQLGQGHTFNWGDDKNEMSNLEFIDFGTNERVVQIAPGKWHSCAIFEGDKVKCWGQNIVGQLGLGNKINLGVDEGQMSSLPELNFGNVGGLKIQGLYTGFLANHNCILFGDKLMKCWGENFNAQLGLGKPLNENVGDSANELNNVAPVDWFVPNIPEPKVTHLNAAFNTLVVLETDSFKGVGLNAGGSVSPNGDLRVGDSTSEIGENLLDIPIGIPEDGRIQEIASGRTQSCLIYTTATGTPNESRHLKCIGENNYGELGAGSTSSEIRENPDPVQLGEGVNPSKVSCSYQFTCMLSDAGQVKCWGRNQFGQLGYGDNNNRGKSANEMGDNLPFVDLGEGRYAVKLILGIYSTCALLDNGYVKCWGYNAHGELGLGDNSNRNAPTVAVNIGCFERCMDITCPEYSTCVVENSTPICRCDEHYINMFSSVKTRMVDPGPEGRCIPDVSVDSRYISDELIKVSISPVAPGLSQASFGVLLHKWISNSEKEQVEDDYLVLPASKSLPTEKVIGPVEPGRYQVLVYPLTSIQETSSAPVDDNDDLYTETLQMCTCFRSVQPVVYQEEGLVMFRFPDVSSCEGGYQISRMEYYDSMKNLEIPGKLLSTFYAPPQECTIGYLEPGIQVVDDLRTSNLPVGANVTYQFFAMPLNTSSHILEPYTSSYKIQWEASVLGSVSVQGENRPAAKRTVWYQLRSRQDEIISKCSGDSEVPDSIVWCQTKTGINGTFHLSFVSSHSSLESGGGATAHFYTGECNEERDDCGFGEGTVVSLKHLSFNVPVYLNSTVGYPFTGYGEESSLVTLVALGTGTFGGTLLLMGSVLLCIKKVRKNTKKELSTTLTLS